MPLTIIIGTGRCGSTMLSRMLQMHPDVLSLSEFWRVFPQEEGSSDVWNLFSQAEASIAAGEISGAEFWRRITATDSDIDAMAGAGILRKDAREAFDPTPGMPSICRLLATLTEDVDSLYAKLALVVPAWPRQSTAEHCRALFAELAAALGRSAVVERTGGSASLMPMLRQQFPEARYVFLHRDGPDSSLSMSRNPLYRLAVMRIVADAVTSGSTAISPDLLPEEIRTAGPGEFAGLIAPPFDAERFMSYPLPAALFGWLWSLMTRTGTSDIREIPHDRWLTMRYERLLGDTRTELSRLADFIGVPADPQWLDRSDDFVDSGRPRKAAGRLHPSALAALRAACAAGARAFDLLESEHAASVPL